ncbi:zf-HC2 domain-containing protein [Streptomyces sp. NBC_01387]|uniref:anti-sigma factor family protein n=1 Tax=unclassified Streptomyces TaxID=2593676 RepID=UPI002254E297|nr:MULTISPECIES: zf-HC2 domain-containing protein [unclassified Streptomyces]MCX4548415.1 zf-HC2 domain-containing protein [Streptomyces sp. NBC_01500]
MSGSSPTPAEQHLGDRLAALVDGELKHDARERVLAHLATCAKCKTEADAQRRLKSVFAETAPPPPSEGLLARLQGLPGGPGGDDPRSGGMFGGRFADGFFGPGRPDDGRSSGPRVDTFGYVPAGHGATALPGGGPDSGFRIHPVGRTDQERSAWRGRRFAFAAASAVSLAAIALGGTLPLGGASDPAARTDGTANNVTPLSATDPVGISTLSDRRRDGASNGAGVRTMDGRDRPPVLSPSVFAAQHSTFTPVTRPAQQSLYSLTTPLLTAASLSPTIRPPLAATAPAGPVQPSPTTTPSPAQLSVGGGSELPVPARH